MQLRNREKSPEEEIADHFQAILDDQDEFDLWAGEVLTEHEKEHYEKLRSLLDVIRSAKGRLKIAESEGRHTKAAGERVTVARYHQELGILVADAALEYLQRAAEHNYYERGPIPQEAPEC